MKLPDNFFDGYNHAYEVALQLDAQGFCVLPGRYKHKSPMVDWKKYQTFSSTDDLKELFAIDQKYNFWLLCGSQSNCVVLDVDNQLALNIWEKRIGKDTLWSAPRVTSSKFWHFYFRLPEGASFESWSKHPKKKGDETIPSFDIKGDKGGVIAPPSVHASGHIYSWEIPWNENTAPTVPDCLYDEAGFRADYPEYYIEDGPTNKNGHTTASGKFTTHLADLLATPPEGTTGRNIWLTAVAGHYAKSLHFEDAYLASVEMANASLEHPLSSAEALKTAKSIWNTEESQSNTTPSPENGWLVPGPGQQLMTLVRVPTNDPENKEGYNLELQTWANFDIQAQGVIRDEKGNRSFVVLILKKGEMPQKLNLKPATLASPLALNVWLSAHGCTVVAPPRDTRKGLKCERLQRYLEFQDPPEYRAVDYLGWHRGVGFVVHDGIITTNGLIPHEGVMPSDRLETLAPYKYGFVDGGFDEARGVLNEILTFHEPDVTTVYASWMVASILKGQDGLEPAHWPFVAIEAVSESGKTSGFFALLNQLFGYTGGGGDSTMAAYRDSASAHNNGLVWADDVEDPTQLMEIIRQATSGGSRSKKAMNRTDQEVIKMVNNFCVSGESLGAIMAEKAQRDRALQIEVPSPVGRISKHGNYSQWDDIQDLLIRYDRDLTKLAGTVVQMILSEAEMAKEFRELRGAGGRHNDKNGVLRVGARVLAKITGKPKIVQRVDRWCAEQEDLGNENFLVTLVLPQLLAIIPPQTNAFGNPAVFVRDGVVWLHIQKVVTEWRRISKLGERNRDLVSAQSILSQLKALGGGSSQTWSIVPQVRGETSVQRRYHSLSKTVSSNVVGRLNLDVTTTSDAVVTEEKAKTGGQTPDKVLKLRMKKS